MYTDVGAGGGVVAVSVGSKWVVHVVQVLCLPPTTRLMSVVRVVRGVGGVCEMCMCLVRGGVGGVGGGRED